jgi:hypothetical protein
MEANSLAAINKVSKFFDKEVLVLQSTLVQTPDHGFQVALLGPELVGENARGLLVPK